MKLKIILIWFLALVLTLAFVIYQRLTGPTYPVSGTVNVLSEKVKFKLFRTHGGKSDHEVKITANIAIDSINLVWKRFKTNDEFIKYQMKKSEESYSSFLPNQPPAGKLEYFIEVHKNGKIIRIPEEENVIIRFKGDVPSVILIPHVFFMFFAMFLTFRTALQVFINKDNLRTYTGYTLIFLVIGGLIFGPVVQYYAFGEFWTGYPFGHDLTDNKTLIAVLGWFVAYFFYPKVKNPVRIVLFAAFLLVTVYLIPHSVLGSELDYNKIDKIENNQNN